MRVAGIIFDKDGTLFDFAATWDKWAASLLQDLADGDAMNVARMARAIKFDMTRQAYLPDSPVIAGTNREFAQLLLPHLPHYTLTSLEDELSHRSARAKQVEVTPLVPLLAELQTRDIALGVVTNDSDHGVRGNLSDAGVLGMFDFVAGFDSGFGHKPAPDPLLACAQHLGLEPAQMVMVGDSTHDLLAGRAAGMRTVGVLTGAVGAAVLAPHADVILPDISGLPAWVDGMA